MKLWAPLAALIFCACAGHRIAAVDRVKSAQALFDAKEYSKLRELLSEDAVAAMPSGQQALARRLVANSWLRDGDADKALQVYQLAVGLHPDDLEISTELGDLLYNVGLLDRARPYYEKTVSIHPNNAVSNLGLARIHRKNGYLIQAEENYRRTLTEWGDNAGIWRELAEVLAEQRKFAEASKAVARAVALSPGMESYLALARFERRQGLREEAYAHLDKAMGLALKTQELKLRKALWLLEDGRLAECETAVAQVLAAEPEDALARWVRGSAALRRGKPEKAKEDFLAASRGKDPFVAETAARMLEELEAQ